jgi:glucose/mannose-6-phosphate isomerase
MINLDDTQQLLLGLGGDKALQSVRGLPQQISSSLDDVLNVAFPSQYKHCSNIVFCGMGGSRFPGLVAYNLYKSEFRVPFEVCDDYVLPGSVGENTLVILSSYSGTTEEVIHCGHEAKKRGALISGFCVGGPLGEWYEKEQLPHYKFNETHTPSRQPRRGFGYTLGSFLGILLALDLFQATSKDQILADIRREIEMITNVVDKLSMEIKTDQNPAKQLAMQIHNRYPYYVVAEHLTGVGNCIQNQTNETAKNMASYRVISEINHHLMEGLQFPTDHKKTTLFVSFYSSLYSPRIRKRFEITEDVVRQNQIEVVRHTLLSGTKLGQVFELLVFSSFVTMYLAGLYEVNPEKIPYVDYFKAQLKKMV